MKRDIIHKRFRQAAALLRLALFAVLLAGPFAASAQTGTKPAKVEAKTGTKTEKNTAAFNPRGAIPGGLKASRGGDLHYNGISDTIFYKPDGPDGPVLEYGLDGDNETLLNRTLLFISYYPQ